MEKAPAKKPTLSRSILGTAEPTEIHQNLATFCRKHLDSELEEVLFSSLSVGASFGLLLRNGNRVFLKAHPPERPTEYLEAVHRVQSHLNLRGFPCPKPILGPLRFGIGLATVDEFMDKGRIPDGKDPQTRHELAKTLFLQIELAGEVSDTQGLEKGWPWPDKDALWPPPHNALYDFEATRKGAEWIDAIAARVKTVVDNFDSRFVVGHTDWSADQVRIAKGEISAVYDWDSLRPEKEVVVVGIAAANFTATWSLGVPNPPTPEETRLFVEDYETARRKRFSIAERDTISAAAIYATAYIARCEHSVDVQGMDWQGSFREALASVSSEET